MLFNPSSFNHFKMTDVEASEAGALLNRLVDLDEILYCGNGIKGDLDDSKMAVRLSPH
jgi:hypothetical protein